MKKIIHLSDLHVGFAHCQSHLNQVVSNIIFLKESASDYLVIITGKIDCLIYGHNHDGRVTNGKWSIPRCYNAGSTTRKNHPNPNKHSPIRVIDLTRDAKDDYDLGNSGVGA